MSILVNNASGWRKDTFGPEGDDRFGRRNERVTAATFDAQFLVDARGGALLIAELATRLRAEAPAGAAIVSLTSGGPMGFPGEVSYGAAKAALENYTMAASVELAADGITANVVYPPVTDTGWVTDDVRRFVAESADHVHVAAPGRGRRGHRVAVHRRSPARDRQRRPPPLRVRSSAPATSVVLDTERRMIAGELAVRRIS